MDVGRKGAQEDDEGGEWCGGPGMAQGQIS